MSLLPVRFEADVIRNQREHAVDERADRQTPWRSCRRGYGYNPIQTGLAVADRARACQGFGHPCDRDDIDETEQHQDRDAGQRTNLCYGDRQRKYACADRVGEGEGKGRPKWRQFVEPPSALPTASAVARQVGAGRRRSRPAAPSKPPVCLLYSGCVEAQHRLYAWSCRSNERVLLSRRCATIARGWDYRVLGSPQCSAQRSRSG